MGEMVGTEQPTQLSDDNLKEGYFLYAVEDKMVGHPIPCLFEL